MEGRSETFGTSKTSPTTGWKLFHPSFLMMSSCSSTVQDAFRQNSALRRYRAHADRVHQPFSSSATMQSEWQRCIYCAQLGHFIALCLMRSSVTSSVPMSLVSLTHIKRQCQETMTKIALRSNSSSLSHQVLLDLGANVDLMDFPDSWRTSTISGNTSPPSYCLCSRQKVNGSSNSSDFPGDADFWRQSWGKNTFSSV